MENITIVPFIVVIIGTNTGGREYVERGQNKRI